VLPSYTHLLTTTMAPMLKYICPCFKCISQKELSKRTIRFHFRDNLKHLNNLIASGAHQNTVDWVQSCHYQLEELLDSLAEESQSSRQPGSPYPDGEHLICMLLITY
jgi:hypothetical protein